MCNHRCVFCGLDFIGYQKRTLDIKTLLKLASELSSCGLKSIMFAGEGEPLLHKDIVEIISGFTRKGINTAVTTNAVLLNREVAKNLVRDCKWIKVSINGGTPLVYSQIHRCRKSDFNKVITNMSFAAKTKRDQNLTCALGMQVVLLPENSDDIETLAKIAKEIGMDYLVVKPYSQHTQSGTKIYKSMSYHNYYYLAEKLDKYNDGGFSVIFRSETMKRWDVQKKNYEHCLALPFWSYIDAGGNVWGCSMFLEDKKFLYGNVHDSTFRNIWIGEKRRTSLEFVEKYFDTHKCRINCRMDKINEYLWELKNPQPHINFI